jgi:hypothetical protein
MATVTETVTTRIPEDMPTPVYAAVGAADAAVHEARLVPGRLEGVRKDVETSTNAVVDDLTKRVEDMRERLAAHAHRAQEKALGGKSLTTFAQELPTTLRTQLSEYASTAAARLETLPTDTRARYEAAVEDAKKQYGELAERGHTLVDTIRGSEPVVAAEKQVKAAEAKTKAARTTARKATAQTTRAAKAAATSTEKAAESVIKAAEAAADQVGK